SSASHGRARLCAPQAGTRGLRGGHRASLRRARRAHAGKARRLARPLAAGPSPPDRYGAARRRARDALARAPEPRRCAVAAREDRGAPDLRRARHRRPEAWAHARHPGRRVGPRARGVRLHRRRRPRQGSLAVVTSHRPTSVRPGTADRHRAIRPVCRLADSAAMTTLASIRPHLAALATALAAATLSVPTIAAGPASVDYAALVEHHGAAVVHVSVREKLAKPDDGTASATPPATQPSKAFGSGFIVSADGYILTNAHVVQHGTRIRVTLKDKRELAARIVGEDATTDVALLKVDAADLPAVRIGDPDRVRVGEPVAAIGSPFGFEHSVTAGIVSAKSRNVDDLLVPFIQTDAAINPGNSGGPLFNSAGEVIGINSRIWTRSGGFQGLSFAIPIDLAMRIADELRD